MEVTNTMGAAEVLRKYLLEADPDLVRSMVQTFAEALMSAEVQGLCNAEYGEVSPERVNSRNGYRSRRWDTRAGTIELAIPKLRTGSYFPDWLIEPRRRAERALVAVVAQCYVEGVSTRRVDDVVRSMGIEGISKSQVSELAKSLDEAVAAFRNRPLDAGPLHLHLGRRLDPKGQRGRPHRQRGRRHRHGGQRRGAPGDPRPRPDHERGRGGLDGLLARPGGPGALGVRLVVSDGHGGLVDAIASVLPGASLGDTPGTRLPRRDVHAQGAKAARSMIGAPHPLHLERPDAEQVHLQHARVHRAAGTNTR